MKRALILFLFVPFILLGSLPMGGCAEGQVILPDPAGSPFAPGVAAEDAPTTVVLARKALITAPDLHELMEEVNKAHKAASGKDRFRAREAIDKLEAYAHVASLDAYVANAREYAPEGMSEADFAERYAELNHAMLRAVVRTRQAFDSDASRRDIMLALREQNKTCITCHKELRVEEH
ncbi:MAG: hypothetical protein RLY93_03360 [Sumerlaeia bacterium]